MITINSAKSDVPIMSILFKSKIVYGELVEEDVAKLGTLQGLLLPH